MSIDTKALDNAAATFERSWYALSEMESAGLPAELDQDARNIARIIQEHGPDYADTEHGDMTAPLLESLARLVQAAKAADRLAALEESNTLLSASLKKQDAQIERLEQDNARLRGLLGAARCPNCDGSGAIPHGPTPDGDWEAEQCQWCYEKQEAIAAGGDQ